MTGSLSVQKVMLKKVIYVPLGLERIKMVSG